MGEKKEQWGSLEFSEPKGLTRCESNFCDRKSAYAEQFDWEGLSIVTQKYIIFKKTLGTLGHQRFLTEK